MLPVNIIANWCRTPATLDDFKSVLREYVECSAEDEYPEQTHAVSWLERTLFTFGDSEWSHNEGSLIFENKRAVLWREDPNQSEQAHLIFLALFSSSLVHLQQSISELMREQRQVEIVPTTFDLREAIGKLNPENFAGVEITDAEKNRIMFSGVAPSSQSTISDICKGLINTSQSDVYDVRVSKLFLRLDEPKTNIALSRDGVLTFNDPNLTLREIVDIVSLLTKVIPSRVEENAQAIAVGESEFASEDEPEVKFYEEEE